MECKRCGNRDIKYFYRGSKGWYCRKCVSFKRLALEEELASFDYVVDGDVDDYFLDFALTPLQEEVADKCALEIEKNDVLLKCVCGAGKTELVVKTISKFLGSGLRVCYAIPRREVVKELEIRFRKIFRDARVVGVYGGHHDLLSGDLLICTTHQLFRYYKTFDLLILDEADAFPLAGNDTLMNIALNSCRGRVIFSTATDNVFLRSFLKGRDYSELNLYLRPSLKPLIVPRVFYGFKIVLIFYLAIILKRMTNQCIIFVSSKKLGVLLYWLFRPWVDCEYVYAGHFKQGENIGAFRDGRLKFLFATSVLERGITIKDINVIIINFYKNAFSKESLIQMLGRVGRNFSNPYGDAYILSTCFCKNIKEAVEEIKEANRLGEMSLLRQDN